MGKLNINNGGVDTNKKMPDIDERFGPYTSIEAANTALGASGRDCITAGLTVGITQNDGSVKEYWYQPQGSGLALVPKQRLSGTHVAGNFASFDANGDLVDSGHKHSDYATSQQGEKADTAYQKPAGGIPVTDLESDVQNSLGKAATAVQQLTVGTTTTGEAGTDASVTNRGTQTNPILDFTIPKGRDGVDAVSPFKGWFTTANIPTTGQEGDYCNVTDTQTQTVTIYRWNTTQNAFIDTGEVPDTATGETFASGETLQQVAIDDSHLANPVNPADSTQPVLAQAEDVMQLKAKLEGVTAEVIKVTTIEDWYPEGSSSGYYNTSKVWTTNSNFVSTRVSVNSYNKVRFIGYNKSFTTKYAYGFLDTDSQPIGDFIEYYNASIQTEGKCELEVEVPAGAAYFVCLRQAWSTNSAYQMFQSSDFYCYLQSGDTVKDELEKLETKLYGSEQEDTNDLTPSDTYTGTILAKSDLEIWTRGASSSNRVYSISKLSFSGYTHIKVTSTNTDYACVVLFSVKPLPLEDGTYSFQDLFEGGYLSSIYNDYTDIGTVGKNTSKEFEIPSDAERIYITRKRNTYDVISLISGSVQLINRYIEGGDINELKKDVNKLKEDVQTLNETVETVPSMEQDVAIIKDLLIDDTTVELTFNDFTGRRGYISNDNVWMSSSNSDASGVLSVKKGQIIHVKGKSNSYSGTVYKSQIAFIDAVPSVGTSVNYVQGEGQIILGDTDEVDFTVENDCLLYCVNHNVSSFSRFPSVLTIRTISAKGDEGSVEITRANVNLCDEAKMISGTIDDNNGDVISGINKITDFIKINLGSNSSYQKTQFIHACSIDSNGSFGYNAIKIAVYDATYNFIGFADYTTYIDKEDVENGNYTLFTNAYYIRVEFSASDYSYYVCNANDRNLPEYSKYNKEDLVQTHDFVADKIHNSDGALTKMLQAALSYVSRGVVTDLGYGDSNTAFDQYVNAVECDSWNPGRYEGLKKQINCSGFVQLALQGISFENSRYVLGSDRHNIITNYVFDSKTTYNYRNSYASPDADISGGNHPIYCSDYGKLYANTQAKYAEDRGFLFKIADNLSNLEVGDVLFHKRGNTSTYRGIGHVSFVCNVRENVNGSKTIDIMEVSGSSATSLAYMSKNITTRGDAVWAARFPMPISDVSKIDIISSYTNEQIVDVTTSETLISTLTLVNPLSKANVYTLIGKLSANPMGKIQPIVKINGATFDGNETTLLQRPDGWFVKHIIIRYNESISNTSDVKVYVKAEEVIEGVSLQLEDLRLYKGYITI